VIIITKIIIDTEKCEGAECAECVDVCPNLVLVIHEGKVVVREKEACSLCETCVDICPNKAIKIEE